MCANEEGRDMRSYGIITNSFYELENHPIPLIITRISSGGRHGAGQETTNEQLVTNKTLMGLNLLGFSLLMDGPENQHAIISLLTKPAVMSVVINQS